MIPTVFPANYIDTLSYNENVPIFPLHGSVDLIDCLQCYAEQTEDEASEWELAFAYPLGGIGFDMLVLDNIVVAKANDYQSPQAFRIYSVEKKTSKQVEVKAQHISYDMTNTPVYPFTASSASDAVSKLRTNTIYSSNWKQHHFYITTNLTSTDEFKFEDPKSMRALLLDGDESIKGTYGGDLIFDNYAIQLLQVGGEDRGVTINYGVDLIDMTQEQNNSEMITGVLPYYKRSTSDESYANQPIIYGSITYGPGTYTIQKIVPLDLTEFFPNAVPTVNEITAKAVEWVANEEIGIPEISLTVSYAKLGQDVRIHDAVRVYFPEMGIDVKSKVSKYKYDVLLERCEEIEVGHPKDSALFSLMDASRLKKGLIPPERIADGSITGSASGSSGKSKIAPGTIGKYEIKPLSIDHTLLSKKAVGGTGGAVQSDNIDDDAIDTEHIKDEAVGTDQIDDGAVNSDKLGDSSVGSAKIQNAAVAYAKLSSQMQSKITEIDNLSADIAYVNRLFASNAQIDKIYAQNMVAIYRVTAGYGQFGLIYDNDGRAFQSATIKDYNGNDVRVWRV